VRGTGRLLRGLRDAGFQVEQFVFSSTMLIHRPAEPGQFINEDWPIEPTLAYPESKVRTEQLIRDERGDIPAVLLRISGELWSARCDNTLENTLQSDDAVIIVSVQGNSVFVERKNNPDVIPDARSRRALPRRGGVFGSEEVLLLFLELLLVDLPPGVSTLQGLQGRVPATSPLSFPGGDNQPSREKHNPRDHEHPEGDHEDPTEPSHAVTAISTHHGRPTAFQK